jgi:hypothetical protein
MSVTKAIPREELEAYFAEFTRRFLRDGSPEATDIEIIGPELGDQTAVQGARLLGITFEPRRNSLELELDVGDHRILDPEDVWALEDDDGFLRSVAVMHRDGSREVVTIQKVGIRRLD